MATTWHRWMMVALSALATACASSNEGGTADASADAATGGGDASASTDAGAGGDASAPDAAADTGGQGSGGCAACTAQSCLAELQGCGGSQACLVALMDFNTCLGHDTGTTCGATFAATGSSARTLWMCMSAMCPSCN